ncbi:MAG: GvpL/GvpF family gas vesicle protein [Solirubrobacterales bacterium]|nr:GvpL/GvpF family gas vesicle protein [Solirubrobacterales bacterium]
MANYVYGIVRKATKAPSRPGIGDAPLQLIGGDGAAALVSELPTERLDMGREELLTHAKVLEEALANGPVLPMRFGVILEDPDAVRRDILEAHSAELLSQLEQFDGKAEMRVRVTYEEQPLMREIVRDNSEISKLRESVRGKPEAATYYDRLRLGELIAEAVERKRYAEAQQILDLLASNAVAVEVADPAHERVVLDASFLLERKRLEEFDDLVERIAREQVERLRVKLTGPLPPHSFVHFSEAA